MGQSLLARISSERVLLRAWSSVCRGSNKRSRGADGVQLQEFAAHTKREIAKLVEELKAGRYAHQPYVGHAIVKNQSAPKVTSNHRPISVATIRDRVVQRAIFDVIWTRIRDRVCTDSSFGGVRRYHVRQRSSTHHGKRARETNVRKNVRAAARTVVDLRKQGYAWVFETDIERFYPSIDRTRLLEMLRPCLKDDSIDRLIAQAIDTGVSNSSELGELASLWNPDIGVPQGGILSPVLANFYLYDLDRAVKSRGLHMVRYVDDLVVLTKTEAEAYCAYEVVTQSLHDLGLQAHLLNAEHNGRMKTRIVAPKRDFEFLGLVFHADSLRPKQARFERLKARLQELTDVRRQSSKSLVDLISIVNSTIRGWFASYSMCNLSDHDLMNIEGWSRRYVAGWMEQNGIIKDWRSLGPSQFTRLGLVSARQFKCEPLIGLQPPIQSLTRNAKVLDVAG